MTLFSPSTDSFSLSSPRSILFEDGWNYIYLNCFIKLESLLNNNLNTSFSNEIYIKLYTLVYKMCIQKCNNYSELLYNKYEESINTYLTNTVLVNIVNNYNNILDEYINRWDKHLLYKNNLNSIFNYLNRFYIARQNKKSLDEISILRFKVLIYEPLKLRVTNCILEKIELHRNGESIDTTQLRLAISIFVAMGMGNINVYSNDFQSLFIDATNNYYSRITSKWVNSETLINYLLLAEEALNNEQEHLYQYLHPSSQNPLFSVLHNRILITHQKSLLIREDGMSYLLKNSYLDHLARLYRLYSRVPEVLDLPARIFKEFVQLQAEALISKLSLENNMGKLVEELVTLHNHFCFLVEQCFGGTPLFYRSIKDGMEVVLNDSSNNINSAETLANFCDRILTKGGCDDIYLLEATLENVIKIFAYLTDKDLFSNFYRKLLSKRLLTNRSSSDEAERSMIGKLKLKCGAQYTSKLEGMITDISMAIESQGYFQSWLRSQRISLPLEMNVQILTSGFWPTTTTENVDLPPNMLRCIDTFQTFYNTRTAQRILKWLHPLSTVTITVNVKQPCDFICSVYQALILQLFNSNASLTIEQIGQMAGLSKEELKQQLRPLVMGQVSKIFIKEPNEGFNMNHIIKVDMGFTSAKRVIKVPIATTKISEEDRLASLEAVSEDRRFAIDGSIVRVMKSRKTLDHSQLISEVIKQLLPLFQADPKVIKKRIEDLINREYLERTADNNNTYNYLA